ncbi:hypothetical protein [Dactylosporangium matsuzakiense]|uniref:hypothetical protein n=1 Tax=Dactylosporangium matsuzakiense TaxID=53360 RepID=UPI0021C28C4B|nr:hypothetical protein [Dactylosporangium matsuzakiense]UWZ43227.1 hypothetical protein Dmats_37970 [Dactylosporangium matsuzakiense]
MPLLVLGEVAATRVGRRASALVVAWLVGLTFGAARRSGLGRMVGGRRFGYVAVEGGTARRAGAVRSGGFRWAVKVALAGRWALNATFAGLSAVKVALAGTIGLVAVVLYSGPASAHGADAPVAVNYVVRVESVSVPGVTVRAVEGGARLELVNRSGREVVVLGLQGEEFLRIGIRGVEENRASPTWVASRSVSGVAAGGDAGAAPDWRAVSAEPRVRWHDERARELPARSWSVPLLVDSREPGIIRGSIAAAPAPATGWWWAGAVVGAVALGLLWRQKVVLALAALGGGAVTAVWIVEAAVLAASPADGVGVQVLARLWPLLTAVAVLVVGGLELFKRVDIVLGIAGACLAVMVGVGDSAVLRYGSLAGPQWGRWAVALAFAVGVGLAVAGGARWYRSVEPTPQNAQTDTAI